MKQSMDVRFLPNPEQYRRMTTEELRNAFLLENLFKPDDIGMVYCDADRAIIGGAVPVNSPLQLSATKKEMSAEHFTERREVGIVNLGGKGIVRAGSTEYPMATKEMLYIGRGQHTIQFSSIARSSPAIFYFVSFPAHTNYPVAHVTPAMAEQAKLGSTEEANRRTIRRYIHAGGVRSCQLVMGLTELEAGSVWNSMPPHTHQRRMEVYLYTDLHADAIVVHLMGPPRGTRSLIMRNHQAVISPAWSLHCGAGTRNYSFVWAMGGENQEFGDMDAIGMKDLL